ncbi:hypothetical protein GMMP15_500009 [Candidatus Magnetomoraceae bacterium gMMP-15]
MGALFGAAGASAGGIVGALFGSAVGYMLANASKESIN